MQVRCRSNESQNQTFLEHADQSPYQIPTHFIDKRQEDEMNNAEANKYLNLHTRMRNYKHYGELIGEPV